MRVLVALVLLVASISCGPAAVGSLLEVPRDSAKTCSKQCRGIGLELDSVVVMANNVGCVCRAARPPAEAAPPGASAAGGMAAIMLQQAAAQRSSQSSNPPPVPTPPARRF